MSVFWNVFLLGWESQKLSASSVEFWCANFISCAVRRESQLDFAATLGVKLAMHPRMQQKLLASEEI